MNSLVVSAIIILLVLVLVLTSNSSYGRGVRNTQEEMGQV